MIIYGKPTEAPVPRPLQFSLRTLLVSIAVVAVVLGIFTAFLPLVQSIKWVGQTNLKVLFVITDASTGQPVTNATIHVRAEPGGSCEDSDSREFTITTDDNGYAMRLCRNCSCFGSKSAFEDTFAVHLPSWWFHVTAANYLDTAPEFLDVLEKRQRVRRGNPSATVKISITLRKEFM